MLDIFFITLVASSPLLFLYGIAMLYESIIKKNYASFCSEKNIECDLEKFTDIFSFFENYAKHYKVDKKIEKILKFYKLSLLLFEVFLVIFFVSLVKYSSIYAIFLLIICFLVANLWIYLFFKFNILSFDAYKTIYFDTKKEIFFIGRKKLLAFCKKNKNHKRVKKAIFYYNFERCITYLAVVFAIIHVIFGMESQ